MKKICVLLVVLIMSTLSVGCELLTGANTGAGVTIKANEQRYTVVRRDEQMNPSYDSMYSFKDERYYYYAYYLGTVENAQLQDNNAGNVEHFTGVPYKVKLTNSTTSSTTISNVVSFAETRCVSNTVAIESTNKITGAISSYSEQVSLGLEKSLTVSGSHSQSTTLSETTSYSKASTYTESASRELEIEFTSNYEKGYYRYALLGDIDVFGILIKEVSTGKCFTDIYNIVTKQAYTFDFSEDGNFQAFSGAKLNFSLTEEEINSLAAPEVVIGGNQEVTSTTYDSGYSEHKIDASGDPKPIDTIDVSVLSKYFTSFYKITFSIRVCMKEEEAGYQEIYLRNSYGETVASDTSIEYGGSGKACTTKGWMDFTFVVDGNKVTDTMTMAYGGHGDNADDWYRYHVQATITATKK